MKKYNDFRIFERFDFKMFRKPLSLDSALPKPTSLYSSSKELKYISKEIIDIHLY